MFNKPAALFGGVVMWLERSGGQLADSICLAIERKRSGTALPTFGHMRLTGCAGGAKARRKLPLRWLLKHPQATEL